MKILLLIFLLNFIIVNLSFGSERIYQTNYHNINIENDIILDSKINEINKIKNISLNNIFKKIISKEDYTKLLKNNFFLNNINSLIKNIIIEDEFISNNKYSANVKVNYKKNEIIKILRNKKISYSDYESPNILIVISETSNIFQEGMSNNNSIYKILKLKNYELINIIYPNLNPNDRFIFPFKKIQNKDIDSVKNIATKYSVKNVFIVNILQKNSNLISEINFYSTINNNIEYVGLIDLKLNSNIENNFYNFLNNWWKNKHQINNAIINNVSCNIMASNIYDMQKINLTLNSLSQIETINLKSIKMGNNTVDMYFFGEIKNLQLKLLHNDIKLKFNILNECYIRSMN